MFVSACYAMDERCVVALLEQGGHVGDYSKTAYVLRWETNGVEESHVLG